MALSATPITPVNDPNCLVSANAASKVYPPQPGTTTTANDVGSAEQILRNQTHTLNEVKADVAGDNFTGAITVIPTTLNSNAVEATGNGTGKAVVAIGGNNSGTAVHATGGAANGIGIEAFGTGTGDAIQASTTGTGYPLNVSTTGANAAINLSLGGIKFSSTQPAANANPGTNTSHAPNQAKCIAVIETDGVGGWTLIDGFGVDDVNSVIVGGAFDLFFKVGLAVGKKPMPVVSNYDGTDKRFGCDYANSSTAKVRIKAWDAAGVALNPATNALLFCVHVMGRH